jgi:hypothetical protein
MNAAPQTRVVDSSLRALLEGLIDYAGLFPPASLDMKTAVAKYAGYLASEHRWMLGRFIVPVTSLGEFRKAFASVHSPELAVASAEDLNDQSLLLFGNLAGASAGFNLGSNSVPPWRLSAIAASESDLAAIERFNSEYFVPALVEAIEVKASSIDDVRRIRPLIPEGVMAYFEIPVDSRPELFHMIAAVNARAKIRTGGVIEAAFPAAEQIAHFIIHSAAERLAFKATAGLHHPLRCVKPLTYQANAPTGMMHGFLNLFLAACAYRELGEKLNLSDLLALLLNESPWKFSFRNDGVTLNAGPNELSISANAIRRARDSFAISFGSCSFEEPIEDLRSLHLL